MQRCLGWSAWSKSLGALLCQTGVDAFILFLFLSKCSLAFHGMLLVTSASSSSSSITQLQFRVHLFPCYYFVVAGRTELELWRTDHLLFISSAQWLELWVFVWQLSESHLCTYIVLHIHLFIMLLIEPFCISVNWLTLFQTSLIVVSSFLPFLYRCLTWHSCASQITVVVWAHCFTFVNCASESGQSVLFGWLP